MNPTAFEVLKVEHAVLTSSRLEQYELAGQLWAELNEGALLGAEQWNYLCDALIRTDQWGVLLEQAKTRVEQLEGADAQVDLLVHVADHLGAETSDGVVDAAWDAVLRAPEQASGLLHFALSTRGGHDSTPYVRQLLECDSAETVDFARLAESVSTDPVHQALVEVMLESSA